MVCSSKKKKDKPLNLVLILFKHASNFFASTIESFTHQNLNEIVEEIKVIIMHKLHNKEYEIQYLRDSNGYIKRDAKL